MDEMAKLSHGDEISKVAMRRELKGPNVAKRTARVSNQIKATKCYNSTATLHATILPRIYIGYLQRCNRSCSRKESLSIESQRRGSWKEAEQLSHSEYDVRAYANYDR